MENEEFGGADRRLGREKITPLPKEGERGWERREKGGGKKALKLLGFFQICFHFCFEDEIGVVWHLFAFFPFPTTPRREDYEGCKKKSCPQN